MFFFGISMRRRTVLSLAELRSFCWVLTADYSVDQRQRQLSKLTMQKLCCVRRQVGQINLVTSHWLRVSERPAWQGG
jgi:hypothetical protein